MTIFFDLDLFFVIHTQISHIHILYQFQDTPSRIFGNHIRKKGGGLQDPSQVKELSALIVDNLIISL